MFRRIFALLAIAAISVSAAGGVSAVEPEPTPRIVEITAPAGTIAASVSPIPVLITDDSNPNGNIRVDNISSLIADIKIRLADYSITADGTPIAAPADFTFGSASWYVFETADFTLDPGTSRDIPFTMNIPADAGAGDHFASVSVIVEAQPGQETVSADGASAKSVLVIKSRLQHRIAGALPQTPTVELDAKNGWDTVSFAAHVGNAGNTIVGHQAAPTPKLELYNLMPWGDASSPERTIQVGGFYVAPQSIRDVAVLWTDLPLYGQYRAVFTLPAADGQPEVIAETTLTVMNLPIVLGLCVVLAVVLLFGTWILIRRRSGRKARPAVVRPIRTVRPERPVRVANS